MGRKLGDMSPDQQTALSEWLTAAEALRDFAQGADVANRGDTRRLIKEVLQAENRVRAVNGYPPRMFSSAGS